MIALCSIATGVKYHKFIKPLIDSAKEFFPEHDFLLWTDSEDRFVENQFWVPDLGFPNATLWRHRTILFQKDLLLDYDYVFNMDIDMLFASKIEEKEICAYGITATLHPGFVGQAGSPEKNTISKAYLSGATRYFCGGFNGGIAREFVRMAREIEESTQADYQRGIMAVWHDESHLNRWLFDNPPALVLSPSFCYPEDYDGRYGWAPDQYPAKIICLDKRKNR